ncbi:protein kinase domain-containing protein [Cellulomonas fimi]|uniref:non-specific serine/threonine protein kinase n=1 Tax=Cellulomonas fimi TaxID=1708 RepID=A0A7Y0QHM1_CELFI|nr:hypothetical protein [Cellulomonas fimi]NMR21316.1 hypothetical protein [Cellulomonas fimi]
MGADAVPHDLATALHDAGYRLGGPVGVGAHGPAWAATATTGPTAGVRTVVTGLDVPPGPAGELVRSRLGTLRAVRHEHLAEVVDVVDLARAPTRRSPERGSTGSSRAGGRWAVLLAAVPGTTLAALLAVRGALSSGEVVTLVVPVAQALAALHAVGLAHGDVSPANVVLTPDGRPVLIDVLGAVTHGGPAADAGTTGFAAPEMEAGAVPGPAADVHALARVALTCLGDEREAAHPGDGSGGRDLAHDDDAGRAGLRELLVRSCASDPAERPTAAELAAACFAQVPARPFVAPDASAVARTTLAGLTSDADRSRGLTARTTRSRHRAPRRLAPAVARVGAAAAAITVCAAVVAGVVARGPAPERPAAGAERPAAGAEAAAVRPDPVEAAVDLTRQRARLITDGDEAALTAVEVAGTPAHAADVRLLAGLQEAGLRVEGLAVEVESAELVRSSPTGDDAEVEVVSALTAHRRLASDGSVRDTVQAQPARAVVLSLRWTTAGWRVTEVSDPS